MKDIDIVLKLLQIIACIVSIAKNLQEFISNYFKKIALLNNKNKMLFSTLNYFSLNDKELPAKRVL